MRTRPLLDLTQLGNICQLSPGLLASLAEAAAVLLDTFHPCPPPPTDAQLIRGGEAGPVGLHWSPPTDQQRASHDNEIDATEDGAYAVAIAAVHHAGYVVVRRTRHGSGCDYLMVRRGEPENDFFKLEVSGIARGDNLAGRLDEKVAQGKGGDLDRPGAAVVVGFEAARILMEEWR